MNKIKILSLFSGIGAFEKSLEHLNIDYELLGYSEIDKYASKAYSLIHNIPESKNLGDVSKIDTSKICGSDLDLITYGFPCQDISIAGNRAGLLNEDGSKTRSGLFFEALRIISDLKPKYAIAENVKNLTSNKFREQLSIILRSLEEAGYNNYYKVVNSKDFGIPQNRERIFIVSIRKDIDKGFSFPKGVILKKKLKEVLDYEVKEKYYIDSLKNLSLIDPFNKEGYELEGIQLKKIFDIPKELYKGNERKRRVYSIEGISPTLATTNPPKILSNNRIRKLTPKECFRLMGFEDKDFEVLVENGISDTQLYKMAGNSIVVNVLDFILKNLLLCNKRIGFCF